MENTNKKRFMVTVSCSKNYTVYADSSLQAAQVAHNYFKDDFESIGEVVEVTEEDDAHKMV